MKIENGNVVPETEEEKAALTAMVEKEKSGLISKRDELLGKLKSFEAYNDIDPEEYKALKAQAEAAEAEKLKIAGNWEAREKQLLDAHAKVVAEKDSKLATLNKSLEHNVLLATATQAIAAEKGSAVLLMPHVRSRTRLDDSGNPVVIDDAGNVRIDAQGKPMSINALIAEMKEDAALGRAFDGIYGLGGAGSNPGQGGAVQQGKFDHLSPTERITAAREAGVTQ